MFARSQELRRKETHVVVMVILAAGLYVLQRVGSTQEGNASFSLSGDYYNRELSGREAQGWMEPLAGSDSEGSSSCDLFRLGALHRALALLPELAAAGCRPSPPSTPEDGGSCQAETGFKHHFCSVG